MKNLPWFRNLVVGNIYQDILHNSIGRLNYWNQYHVIVKNNTIPLKLSQTSFFLELSDEVFGN